MNYAKFILLFLTFTLVRANPYLVDFDTSMGMHDPYLREFYKKLIKELSRRPERWFRYVPLGVNTNTIFSLLKDNYNRNKIPLMSQSDTRIPRTFHQIWVGPHPFPEKYKRWQKTWQSIPGWTYKLWTDKDVENYPLINKDAYYKEKNLGARADILRLEILYNEGGVYVDTDLECIKPEMFNVLHSAYDFYCGLHPLDCRSLFINNAIIGSIPKHPILRACIETLPVAANGVPPDMRVVSKGPGLLSAMTFKHMNKGYRDMVFPSSFFYPLGVEQMRKYPYTYLQLNNATLEKVKRDLVRPETLAIHWWDGSWLQPSANLRCYKFDEEEILEREMYEEQS